MLPSGHITALAHALYGKSITVHWHNTVRKTHSPPYSTIPMMKLGKKKEKRKKKRIRDHTDTASHVNSILSSKKKRARLISQSCMRVSKRSRIESRPRLVVGSAGTTWSAACQECSILYALRIELRQSRSEDARRVAAVVVGIALAENH